MAVRNFDGVDDTIVWSTGGLSAMTFGTFAAIVRFDLTAGLFQGMLGLHTGAGSTGTASFYADTNQPALHVPGTGSQLSLGGGISTATWYLIVARKPTGTTTGRFSVYNFTATTWAHNAGGSPALPNWTAPGASGQLRNNFNASNFLDGQMAVRAAWANSLPWTADAAGDTALIAAGLHTALTNWVTAAPSGLWVYNQDPLAAVDDLVGTANQTSVTGTNVVTGDDPPGFDFALGGPVVAYSRPMLPGRIGPDRRVYLPKPRFDDTTAAIVGVTRDLDATSDAVAEHDAGLVRDRGIAATSDAVAEHVADLTVTAPTGGPVTLDATLDAVAEHAAALGLTVWLTTEAPHPPTDISDAGTTSTPPTDISDAGTTSTPPSDISDAGDVDPNQIVAEHYADLTVTAPGGGPVTLDATLDAVAEHAGDLTRARPLAAASDAVAEHAADLARGRSLAAVSDAVAEHAGVLERARPIVGDSGAVADHQGVLEASRPLSGASDAVAEHAAALIHARGLTAASDAVAEHAGDISIGGETPLDATLDAVAEHVGQLSTSRPIGADSGAVAEHGAELARDRPLVAASDAVAQTVAELARDRPLTATSDAVAEAVAVFALAKALDAVSSAVAEHAGDLTVEAPAVKALAGALDAVADHAGALRLTAALTAALDAVAEHQASLGATKALVGASSAVADHIADLTIPVAVEAAGIPVLLQDLTHRTQVQDMAKHVTVTDPTHTLILTDPTHKFTITTNGQSSATVTDTAKTIILTDPDHTLTLTSPD